MGHFGAFLLFPGFRFQPISRFLVLPGAWARFSPCRDRLAFARRAYRTAEGELDIQAGPLRSYVLFCFFVPLLSGAAFPVAAPSIFGRHTSQFRSRAFEPFPCSSSCLSRQCSGPGRSHALLSERNEALLPIGDRGKAAPGAVAVPRGDRGPTSPTIRAAYPVPTRGHCKCPAGRLKLRLD